MKPLPAASLHIVLALLDGELHGYALMRRVAELSDGAVRWAPERSTARSTGWSTTGLIVETTDRADRTESERRRYYELTATGRTVALAELARLRSLVHKIGRHLPGIAPA